MLKRLLLTVIALLSAVVLYWGATIWTFSDVHSTRKADTAIVLGAAVYESEPSPVLQGRLLHALALYEEGRVSTIIATGGKAEGDAMSEAAVAKRFLHARGVPLDAILTEEQSTITAENLRYAKDIMTAAHMETALIVSDPLHMKRAMLLADREGLKAAPAPTPYSAYQTWKTKWPFFMREWFYYSGTKILQ